VEKRKTRAQQTRVTPFPQFRHTVAEALLPSPHWLQQASREPCPDRQEPPRVARRRHPTSKLVQVSPNVAATGSPGQRETVERRSRCPTKPVYRPSMSRTADLTGLTSPNAACAS
jgi:hypothetical protein